MKTPNKILVPTDLSAYSLTALQYAQDIASYFGSEIVVVYVAEHDSGGTGKGVSGTRVGANEEAETRKFVARLLIDHNLVSQNLQIVIRCGLPAHEICEAAKELRADLIVMSTHGRTGLRHVMLGSVAERVVRYSACPVLTLKPEEFLQVVGISEEEVADSLHIGAG